MVAPNWLLRKSLLKGSHSCSQESQVTIHQKKKRVTSHNTHLRHPLFRWKMSQLTVFRRRTNLHLPDEIVLEILTRLPVNSLLRFRCVCKTWYSYITNPNFISTHLSSLLSHNHGCVIYMRRTFPWNYSSSPPTLVACDRTFERVSEFRIPFTFQSASSNLVGSCNGILCLTDYIVSEFNGVYLWNPSIRKFKKLPDTCLSWLHHPKLGFGYDSLNNDYKVVRISRSRIKDMMPPLEVEVYTLSLDSWKRIGFGIPWRPNVVFWEIKCFLPSPFVSGHLHWMILYAEDRGGRERRSTHMILSFDVNSEKFKELPLPADEGSCCVIYLTSFKGKLALIKLRYGV